MANMANLVPFVFKHLLIRKDLRQPVDVRVLSEEPFFSGSYESGQTELHRIGFGNLRFPLANSTSLNIRKSFR